MGYYINTDSNGQPLPRDKFSALAKEPSCVIISEPPRFEDIPQDRAAVCVADNGPFQVAAYCFSASELEAFSDSEDARKKYWLLLDIQYVRQATGYRG